MEIYLIAAIVLFIIFWIISTYNKLITLVNNTDEAFADIDVQLKRRYDLIPNLVTLIKSYAKHERGVFEEVARVRSEAMKAETVAQKDNANDKLISLIGKIIAIAEDYPKLRATENFQKLQDELTETEDVIAKARRYYNGNIRELNNKVQSFPSSLIAATFGFKSRDFFQADLTERADVRIS